MFPKITLYIFLVMCGIPAVLKVSENSWKNVFSRVPFKQFELLTAWQMFPVSVQKY